MPPMMRKFRRSSSTTRIFRPESGMGGAVKVDSIQRHGRLRATDGESVAPPGAGKESIQRRKAAPDELMISNTSDNRHTLILILPEVCRGCFVRDSSMAKSFVFSSESVGEGHPDKVADFISDSVLDACLAYDARSRVACETLVKSNMV